jgi:hypothetical protein
MIRAVFRSRERLSHVTTRHGGRDGRELLLAIDQENEAGEVSFEIMLGMALELGEFRA